MSNEKYPYDNVTNLDILHEIQDLKKQINGIRQMIYETNSDFFDTAQIANFDNRYPVEIQPLTNRELILYAMQKYPVVDPNTGREKLLSRDEMIKEGFQDEDILYNFELKQSHCFDEDNDIDI